MESPPITEIRVGGRTITIRIDPAMTDWGNYFADQREIVISPRAAENFADFYETIRHEIKHVALDMAGLTYLPKMPAYEEPIVRALDALYDPAVERFRAQMKKI